MAKGSAVPRRLGFRVLRPASNSDEAVPDTVSRSHGVLEVQEDKKRGPGVENAVTEASVGK